MYAHERHAPIKASSSSCFQYTNMCALCIKILCISSFPEHVTPAHLPCLTTSVHRITHLMTQPWTGLPWMHSLVWENLFQPGPSPTKNEHSCGERLACSAGHINNILNRLPATYYPEQGACKTKQYARARKEGQHAVLNTNLKKHHTLACCIAGVTHFFPQGPANQNHVTKQGHRNWTINLAVLPFMRW